ncbi:Pentatricopeptide repeat-containing protein [Thalictrum thalictroides]|uniref:Pentatricopeptide repeat-containing protein n=1 Tax=Thalictrum thalictroides TaxID=46969 RepID=A0A7J6WLE1_THATH|nr:Pentatricopeptide repeat-containing protein [Thalictrum thalictroides]
MLLVGHVLSHSHKSFEASKLFNQMRLTRVYPNHFTFSAILPTYAELMNKLWDKAVEVFREVLREDSVSPDQVSISNVFSACANTGSLYMGRQVHGVSVKRGLFSLAYVKNSILDMYNKCGCFEDVVHLFETIEEKVIHLFEEMLSDGIEPDYMTFVSILSACSHAGQVETGLNYFDKMSHVRMMKLGSEHYSCMVDMLTRAGRLEEAKKFIETMPVE